MGLAGIGTDVVSSEQSPALAARTPRMIPGRLNRSIGMAKPIRNVPILTDRPEGCATSTIGGGGLRLFVVHVLILPRVTVQRMSLDLRVPVPDLARIVATQVNVWTAHAV